ncbi:MAG: hypothetical protein KC910_30740, partial [Candidatus Eremiobacteraeota bacterium]|nr:hypothetical protein [Candidatus Eremiobacteraeota bacterium]
MRYLALFLIFCSGFAWAEPGNRTLVKTSWGEVFCDGGLEVTSKNPGRFTVTTPSGPINVVADGSEVLIQYPDQALRVRLSDTMEGHQVLVQFQNKNYRILHQNRQVKWTFPDDEVFFRLRAGKVYDVLGNQGFLRIRRQGPPGNYRVVSDIGESQFEVVPTGVTTHEGEPPESHPYLTRGVIFQEGPVGLAVYLPQGNLTGALSWTGARRYEAPLPEPKQPPAPPEEPVDPLKANDPEWDSPALKSTPVDAAADPMKLKPQ